MGKVTVREALIEDSNQIVESQIEMALETEDLKLDPATVALGVGEVFKNPSRGKYFVAEADGSFAGCLMVTSEWSDWRNREVWWIQSVYVCEESRGAGVYSALYRHLQELVSKSDRIAGIRLYVDKSNSGAQTAYQRLGMDSEHYQLFEWMP